MNWAYRKLTDVVQGRGLAEDNFASETVSSEQILIREVLQNSLDARRSDFDGPVTVSFRLLGESKELSESLNRLLPRDYKDRLRLSVPDAAPFDFANASALVIEDFETTGLNGHFQDACQDGSGENWNGFWFREGEGAKGSQGSNGRAGQGKITYYRLSQARCLFGLTVRSTDSKMLLMGRSSFRRAYWFPATGNKNKYDPFAFWCEDPGEEEKRWPSENGQAINQFIQEFGLERGCRSGLSLVIPYPQDLDMKMLLEACLLEFYIPIVRRRVVVRLEDKTIDDQTVDPVFKAELPPERVHASNSVFTEGYRTFVKDIFSSPNRQSIKIGVGWESSSSLQEDLFGEGRLAEIREAYSKGALISVEFPLTVQKQAATSEKKQASFAVYLQFAEDLKRPEEAYLRGDLLIAHEKYITGQAIPSRVRAMTHISNPDLSALLAEAEEPTHLKWNGSKPRLAENFKKGKETVAAVRNAAPRLLRLIEQGSTLKNTKALASFFTKANADPGKQDRGQGSGGATAPPDIPVLSKKKSSLLIRTSENAISIHSPLSPEELAPLLPISVCIKCFLLEIDGERYDPFDFDFADSESFKFKLKGAEKTGARHNKIEFVVLSPDFEFSVTGFDPNVRMKAKVEYTESGHAEDINEE